METVANWVVFRGQLLIYSSSFLSYRDVGHFWHIVCEEAGNLGGVSSSLIEI